MKTIIKVLIIASFVPGFAFNCFSQNNFNSKFEKRIFGCYARDIKDFEDFVIRAKKSGATHINLSNEDLPFSKWEYDTPGDPYPAWVITNMGLLKIATPEVLKKYLPQDYAQSVMIILEERCKILRKYGLKASFKTFEPQMLPEQVYIDHPKWRGPRVDHPLRSKVARFSPDIDNAEVLQLYKESFTILLKHCPEIEIMSLTTNDSGTGLSWSGGLYSGATGNTFTKERSKEERILDFFSVFTEVAKTKGIKFEIDFWGTREEHPEEIAKKLLPGMAIENYEGPDASEFKSSVGYVMDFVQVLYPVIGVPEPVRFLNELESANKSKAKRLFVLFGDRYNKDLYFNLYDRFAGNPPADNLARLTLLKKLAVEKAGEQASEDLLNLWLYSHDLRTGLRIGQLGGYGGSVFYIGSVMERWLTRPFVPFPLDLKPGDRDYYRKYQLQATTEENASDMSNLQGNKIYAGMSGYLFMARLMSEVLKNVELMQKATDNLLKSDISQDLKIEFLLLDKRLKAVSILARNAENAVYYQAQLNNVLNSKVTPNLSPDIDTPSSYARSTMLETARTEIDNTVELIELLESTNEPILDLAPTKELEDIRRLGPDFKDQLNHKLRIMNEHWLDYNKLFTLPNK